MGDTDQGGSAVNFVFRGTGLDWYTLFGINDFVTVTRLPGAEWDPIVTAVQQAASAHL